MIQDTSKTMIAFDRKNVKLVFLLLLFFAMSWYAYEQRGWVGYYEKFMYCFNFIEEGTLYGGQPYCESGGPPNFFIPYLVFKVFGESLFHPAMIVLSLIIALFTLYFILQILAREQGKQRWTDVNFFLPSLLFIFLIYLPSLTRFETILAATFFIGGYYVLLYTDLKHKELISGLFFAVAVLSKPTALVPLCFVGLYYLIRQHMIFIENKRLKLKFSFSMLLKMFLIVLPTIVGILFFRLLYKYFFIYFIQVMQHQEISVSYPQALLSLVTLEDPLIMPLIVCLGLATYFFWKKKALYAFLAGPVQIILVVMVTQAFNVHHLAYRYWVLLNPFLIITLCLLYEELQGKKTLLKIFLNTAFVLILLFPGMYDTPLNTDFGYMKYTSFEKERIAFIRELHYPYQIIPEQERMLFEHSEAGAAGFFKEYAVSVSLDRVDVLSPKETTPASDAYSLYRYKQLLGDNLKYGTFEEQDSQELRPKEREVVEKINRREYSFIHSGPPEWIATEKVLNAADQDVLREYCTVDVPTNVWLTESGLHIAKFKFKDQQQCLTFVKRMVNFYNQHWDSLCTKDQFSANLIGDIIRENSIIFPRMCASGGELMKTFETREEIYDYALFFTLLVLVLSIGVQGLFRYRFFPNGEKKIFLVLIIGLVLFLISFIIS